MWQALARYLGSNATVSPGESGETVFIAEASDWDSIGFTSKLFLEGLKAVSFLALDEAVYVSGTEFFVDAGVAKSDTSRADVAGAKRLLLLAPLVTCCHRIHLPQQRNRCGASLGFQIEIQQELWYRHRRTTDGESRRFGRTCACEPSEALRIERRTNMTSFETGHFALETHGEQIARPSEISWNETCRSEKEWHEMVEVRPSTSYLWL